MSYVPAVNIGGELSDIGNSLSDSFQQQAAPGIIGALLGQSQPRATITAQPPGGMLGRLFNPSPPAPNPQAIAAQAGTSTPGPANYYARTAQIENPKGDPNATSPTGATGTFQFMPSTWAKYGGGADIHGDQTAAMTALTQDNNLALSSALGRPPTAAELYLAHQQGAGGAIKLLTNPAATPAQLGLGNAVSVNGGDPNAPAADFVSKWGQKFAGVPSPFAPPDQPASQNIRLAGPVPAPNTAPQAIQVPGYQGTFTRAQANDADGVPSPAEWDAAAKSSGAPAAPVQTAQAAPIAAPAQTTPSGQQIPPLSPQALVAALGNKYAAPFAQAYLNKMVQGGQLDIVDVPQQDAAGNFIGTQKTIVNKQNGQQTPFGAIDTSKVGEKQTSEVKNYEYGQTHQGFTQAQIDLKQKEQPNHVVGRNLVDPTGKVLFTAPETGASIKPEVAQFLGERLARGDTSVLVGLGRGAQGPANVLAVQGAALQSAHDQGLDPQGVLDNIAQFGGQKAAGRVLGTIGAKTDFFGQTANTAADLALEASNKVGRSNWVPIAKLEQNWGQITNDPVLADFVIKNNTLAQEYAKAINPAGGALTVSAAEHAYEMLNTAVNQDVYATKVNALKQEIANARASQGKAMQQLRQGAQAPAPAATSATAAPKLGSIPIPIPAAQALRANPARRAEFDLKYGDGASAQVLGPGQ